MIFLIRRSFFTPPRISLLKATSRMMSSSAGTAEPDVVFDTAGKVGFITLNRPKQLNALNLNMIRLMYPQLRRFEANPDVGVIVVRGAGGGRAFCAGGDIVTITKSAKSDTPTYAYNFFREEYLLDYATSCCPKPYVALIDGVCMGGGFGISAHGRFRVATERTLFAMPETAIGLFPDVGGGHFLSRMPGNLGVFLGLTGFRLKGWDVYKSGIATHFCRAEILPELERVLARQYDPTVETVQRTLDDFHTRSAIDKEFILQPYIDKIAKLFDINSSVEQIIDNLDTENSDWSKKQIDTLRKASPTSLKITSKLLQHGDNLNLAECLQIEYRLAVRCCEDTDFAEGVRALLVDEDQSPKWDPPTLEEVTDKKIDFYFSPLPEKIGETEVVKEYQKPVPGQASL